MITSNCNFSSPSWKWAILLFTLVALSGCASVNGPADEHDPFESYNRAMYTFNNTVDEAVVKPVAETYKEYVPSFIQTGVSNFFSNLGDVVVLFNDLLQFKFKQAGSDLSRLAWNSTVGMFGLFDVASHLELPKHHEDFGQTLATWGVDAGPYIVLPFFGPSTVRGTVGLVGDIYSDPLWRVSDTEEIYWGGVALRAVDKRVELLSASKIRDEAAFDPYIFEREAYLQYRKNLIYDGSPPVEEFKLDDNNADADLELELELELENKKQNKGDSPPPSTP